MRTQSPLWTPCLALPTLAAISLLFSQAGAAPPKVTINSGVLKGLRSSAEPGGAAFLGIPYAAPPVGGLRWEPPQPPRPWFGARKAVRFAPACPQLPAGWLPYPVWSEDCLSLNIWTPKLAPDTRLPVIVYFHGGSNRAGYSQLDPLGPTLSSLGFVVVTANYRLGPLGFFAHPALTAASPHRSSGNYGILDQIQALRWVNQNIASFGGDPGRITAMGQSAGAFDICLMMASPLARGLFRQAIMESGDCESTLNEDIRRPVSFNQVNGTGEGNGEELSADLGVADAPGAIQKLRSMPASAILKAWSRHPELLFDAIVDGWVIPDQPATIFAEGRQMRIPVLVGSNVDEGTVFGPGPATTSAYWKYLRADTGRWAGR
jgi:para-nitrobenzyl esterase